MLFVLFRKLCCTITKLITQFAMIWDMHFLLFCVNMYIVKRHFEETKKVELTLVRTRLFSILWKSLILLNSISRSLSIGGDLFKWWCNSGGGFFQWLRLIAGGGGVQNGQKSDDVIRERPLSKLSSEAAVQRCSLGRCSKNMQQIYGRTLMPKCDFDKAAFLYPPKPSENSSKCSFLEKVSGRLIMKARVKTFI